MRMRAMTIQIYNVRMRILDKPHAIQPTQLTHELIRITLHE